MKVGKAKVVPKTECLSCGYEFSRASAVGGDCAPKCNDITLCISCGYIMAYNSDLSLREITDEEIILIAGDKRVVAASTAIASVRKMR